jgi:hypothetical protein
VSNANHGNGNGAEPRIGRLAGPGGLTRPPGCHPSHLEIDMKRSSKIALGVVGSLGLGLAVAVSVAHPGGMGPGMMHGMGAGGMGSGGMGPGMAGGMGPPMMRGMGPGMMHGAGPAGQGGAHGPMGGPMAGAAQHDDAFAADMHLVRDLILNHDRIKRTVTNLPDGIRTVTETDDPQTAQALKAHVASMEKRLKEGREFNLFSPTIPVLFQNKDKIKTVVETTDKGSIMTQTSSDPAVVAALQAHAVEVSELVRDGRIAMMRSAMAAMGRTAGGPGAGPRFGPNFAPPATTPSR